MIPLDEYVHAVRHAANPFNRASAGAPASTRLDAVKTARDLGHLEPETVARLHRLQMPAPVTTQDDPFDAR